MRPLVLLTFALLSSASVAADPPATEIKTTKVAGSVYMLEGSGGNIGVSAGADGMFMIDDQYAPMTPNIRKALAAIGPQPLKFVVNTHWHGDHTGGNENLGGAGAVIVAHDKVRERMSSEQFIKAFGMKVPPSPAVALPVITFADAVTFHLNGDEIQVFHVAPAHTDGDSIIHFRKAKVMHLGDTFFNGLYPFIDVSSGGSIDGVIAAVDLVLALAGDDTRLIPGHGPLGDKAALRKYREMLLDVRAKVAGLIKQGKTLAEVQAAKPSAKWDADWGKGFLTPEQFVGIVYESLAKAP